MVLVSLLDDQLLLLLTDINLACGQSICKTTPLNVHSLILHLNGCEISVKVNFSIRFTTEDCVTGLPELQSEADLDYVRVRLQLNDTITQQEALAHFRYHINMGKYTRGRKPQTDGQIRDILQGAETANRWPNTQHITRGGNSKQMTKYATYCKGRNQQPDDKINEIY